jgi:hypothetical protein
MEENKIPYSSLEEGNEYKWDEEEPEIGKKVIIQKSRKVYFRDIIGKIGNIVTFIRINPSKNYLFLASNNKNDEYIIRQILKSGPIPESRIEFVYDQSYNEKAIDFINTFAKESLEILKKFAKDVVYENPDLYSKSDIDDLMQNFYESTYKRLIKDFHNGKNLMSLKGFFFFSIKDPLSKDKDKKIKDRNNIILIENEYEGEMISSLDKITAKNFEGDKIEENPDIVENKIKNFLGKNYSTANYSNFLSILNDELRNIISILFKQIEIHKSYSETGKIELESLPSNAQGLLKQRYKKIYLLSKDLGYIVNLSDKSFLKQTSTKEGMLIINEYFTKFSKNNKIFKEITDIKRNITDIKRNKSTYVDSEKIIDELNKNKEKLYTQLIESYYVEIKEHFEFELWLDSMLSLGKEKK